VRLRARRPGEPGPRKQLQRVRGHVLTIARHERVRPFRADLRRLVGPHDRRRAFYVELARETDGPLVELAVGNGRVAIPVARETGRHVLGIDSSPAMLTQARERAAAAGVDLELREGDMRELELDQPAGLIYVPFRSLGHLPTWADRRRVFERAYASLRPGGRFAWNFFVFDPRIAAANDGEWLEQSGIRHRIDHAKHDNRVDITLESGAAISLWWLNRSEWEGLIETAGFEVEALYGGFDRRPFDENANEFVWVVRKPGGA
jgi:SAM-dependent methyltransferase